MLPSPVLYLTFFFLLRFFCNEADELDCRAKDDSDQIQDVEGDCKKLEAKPVAEDASLLLGIEKTRTTSLLPGETQRSCFRWFSSLGNNSGNPVVSHTVSSQHFDQQKSNCVASQADDINGVQAESGVVCESDEESSPLTELNCSLQSQGSCEPSECNLESPKTPQSCNNNSETEVRKQDFLAFAFTFH